jgi:murein DD-endopeptidase MepM/ murein hydrolase activator NlpD
MRTKAHRKGAFVPVQVGPPSSPFAREFSQVQEAVLATDRLRRIRIDPFLGRPAMHTGIDLRDDYGAPIRATAAGRVVTAE